MQSLLRTANRYKFYKNILAVAILNHKPFGIRSLKRRLFFIFIASRQRYLIDNFVRRITALNMVVTPHMLGMLEWPYIHNKWDIKQKFDRVASHYEILSKSFPELMQIDNLNPYVVIDFSNISKDVVVKMDHPSWFVREGELVLNIFQENLRIASIAFTLGHENGITAAYIGAIQGIHSGIPSGESLERYKTLTKDFEGLRPRSLLLEVLKVVLTNLGVKKMFAVSEQNRHHRHRYFAHNEFSVFKNNYNIFWEEHDGVLDEATGFYLLPLALSIKDMMEIPSKKRSMYRRRYEIIESIKTNIKLNS